MYLKFVRCLNLGDGFQDLSRGSIHDTPGMIPCDLPPAESRITGRKEGGCCGASKILERGTSSESWTLAICIPFKVSENEKMFNPLANKVSEKTHVGPGLVLSLDDVEVHVQE